MLENRARDLQAELFEAPLSTSRPVNIIAIRALAHQSKNVLAASQEPHCSAHFRPNLCRDSRGPEPVGLASQHSRHVMGEGQDVLER